MRLQRRQIAGFARRLVTIVSMNKEASVTPKETMSARWRLRLASAGAVATIVLAAAGSASAFTSTYRAGPLTATFSASTHTPNCKQKWPVTVTAKLHGKPAHATAFYQFLFAGQVVSKQYPFGATRKNRHDHVWAFYGGFTDNTFGPFGSASVGQPLAIRAVVKVLRYAAYPSFSVRVVTATGCPAR
jgi:hypothetical protein